MLCTLHILQLGNKIHSNESLSHFHYCIYVAFQMAYAKTWSGVKLWSGVVEWSGFLEFFFGVVFWSQNLECFFGVKIWSEFLLK